MRRRFLAAAAILLLAACGGGTRGRAPSPSGGAGGSPAAPSPSAIPATPPPTCAARTLAGMGEDQRVGQLFSLGLAGDQLGAGERAAILSLHLGSVWFVETSQAGTAGIRAVSDAVQAQATPAATAGAGLFVAANQEGGQIQSLAGPGFSRIPPAVVQGGEDPALLQGQAATWGGELRAAGVNLNFAPVMDVVPAGTEAQNQPIGALQREYGHDPQTAGSHGSAFIRGMQQAGVATTVKHFPGLGRVQGNTDFASGVVDSVTAPGDPSLASFQQGIAAGAPFAMVALATYTQIDGGHLAVFSPAVMHLLRAGMGFGGVIVSDDLGAAQAVAAIPPEQRGVDFLAAGGDMVVSKTIDPTVRMVTAVRTRAATDAGFRAIVDASALRVLNAKQAYGLLRCG